jgi:cytochrome o ubiquinol oxidase subunit 3
MTESDPPLSPQAVKYPGLNLGAAHREADKAAETMMFGFWVFLMSDAILFGMVFATYVTSVYATAGGPGPRDLYSIESAFIGTLLLLASSFTFGMASLALKYKHGKARLTGWMALTFVLGVAFLGLELHDFGSMFAKGGGPSRSGFLSAFFDLVPLHGLHVAAGCLWLLSLFGQIARYGLDTKTKLGIMRLALFWHFLDIVWIAIFSVVYLAGLA